MKEIPLSQGKVALVDDEDYDRLTHLCSWHVSKVTPKNKQVYAYGALQIGYKRQMPLAMHRVIMKAKSGQLIDHINGNGLDNRKENLRFCTRSEDGANRMAQPHSSMFKGVSFHKQTGQWKAQIKKDGKNIHIGYFRTEEAAARAYDAKAKELFGEFAQLNFTEDES